MMQFPRLRFLLAGVAFTALASPAFALDGTDFAAKLNAAYAINGATLAYEAVDVNDDSVVLKGASIKSTMEKADELKIGDLTFDGVEELSDGGYTVETVAFPDIDRTADGARLTAKDISIAGLRIPAKAGTGGIDDLLYYESAGTGPVTVEMGGKTVFSIEKSESNLSRQDGDKGIDFDGIVSGVKADLSEVKDAKAKMAIDKLGLQNPTGEFTMEGSWDLASGVFDIRDNSFNVDNVGRLSIGLNVSGYTLQLLNSFQEAFKAAEANPNKEAANQALGLSAMGLMQQLSFTSASIRFEDASITKRLLDYFGAEQGVTGEQLAQSIKGLAPIMIAQLNLPDLQNELTAAINTYLDAPKNLTITAEPEKPVPFPMIMGAGMGAPNTLPSVLGVKVTAND
ncbi:hypothetical protein ASG39_07155 [Rhizobium sp. Leaf371]|uniref:hypothetical protein n=1 Tax=unclassified Rhizobium TaxID=2613769 RepID=UPI00071350B6|nr:MULTISPECIES: hypothetical protein [unclassified Rhizobium]KQS68089.1 hypothetical protein ASG39_07155 [Rhizobium sp. Leaf371]TCM57634.1 hypothetical protein C8J36_102437 [Rhizobium sp. PP-F2F-G48]